MLEVQYSQARACFIFLFEELPCTSIFCEWELNGTSQVWALRALPADECSDTWGREQAEVLRLPSALSPNPGWTGHRLHGVCAEVPSVGGDVSFWKARKRSKAVLLHQTVLQIFVYRARSGPLFLWQCKGLQGVDTTMIRNRAKKKFPRKYLLRHQPWFL